MLKELVIGGVGLLLVATASWADTQRLAQAAAVPSGPEAGTATITAIDRTSGTVTLKGPQGDTDTIQVKDRQVLQSVREGDLVEVTYGQALAVSLDRPAP